MCKFASALVVGLLTLTFPLPLHAASPVIITEFLAGNDRSISDEDGDKSDWIEIYNASAGPVNLAGWSLTDVTNNLTRWQFPSTNLAPNSYMVVFASNKDRRRAGSELHTNFRLSDDGEYLALVQPGGVIATEFHPAFPIQAPNVSYGYASDARDAVVLGTGAVARAFIPTNEMALLWTELGFNDSTWLSGTTGIGYDNNTASVNYNPLIGLNVGAMRNVNQTVYIRVPFVLTNVAELDTLTLRMQYEDGFIAYLNGGALIASGNAPAAPLYISAALGVRDDGIAITFADFNVTAFRDFLRVGTNLLALHGLNSGIGSSDLLVVPQLIARTRPTGTLTLRYFPLPTPGAPNNDGVDQLGPIVTDETHTPHVPLDNQDVLVTARVRAALRPVSSVRLRYRIMFAAEVEVPMFDDGAHGDGAALDGLYGASIPANTSTPGQMIRWYIHATDTSNVVTRIPAFAEPLRSPEYLGTIVFTPQTNNLPILHWFIQNPTGADNTTGSRASLFFGNEFYDNVGMNLHGQSSAGFPKKSYDIDFHRGYNFRWAPGEKRVDDINLLTIYPDKAHVRNILAYETFRDAGTPYHFVQPVRIHQNGVFFSDAHLVENGDENYLERLGLDTQGALYKMYNTLNVAAGEKKTRKDEDTSDLQNLINGALLPPGGQRNAYLFDNINIPETINYLAAQTMTGNVDCCHKNYYLYRDTEGTGEWQILPWDVDLSFGRVWSGATTYWDDALNPNTGLLTGNNNTLMSALYGTPEIRQMYFRRLRTLMEELLQPPGTPANEGRYETRADELLALIGPDAALDLARWGTWCCSAAGPFNQSNIPIPANYLTMTQAIAQLKTQYLPARRTFLFSNQVVTAGGEIPLSQPANPVIAIHHVEYSPASSNQAQEYIELRNANAYAVDISRWRLSGGIEHTFIPGTVMPANSALFLSPDVKAFRARATAPRGGQGLFVQGNYQGQLSARGESLRLDDQFGRLVAATNYAGTPSLVQQFLRITELMYNPSRLAGNTNSGEEFEFVELKNIGTVPLDLNGVRFTGGISFDFTGSTVTTLGAGESVLVVRNPALFTVRYGPGFSIAGQYSGSLDNSGERIQLVDAVGEEVLDFSYNNSWYPITDGLGFSLVAVDEQAAPDAWDNRSQWRPSGTLLGSPGAGDPAPPEFALTFVNEALTRTVGVPDSVELFNPGTNDVDVSGWYLTDDFNTPAKFRIPDGTIIPAGGFRVFTESNFNSAPGPNSFALSSDGDELYLFGATLAGDLTGYYHGFEFGAAEEGVSFGRHVSSDGREHFVAQIAVTLDAPNAGPSIGPVVISEIMYHPVGAGTNDNTADEYIELVNISGSTVMLFDQASPTNRWRLGGAVEFTFSANTSLAPGERLLVVSFAPTNTGAVAAFRAKFNVPPTVSVFGPYIGVLDNHSAALELVKPTSPLPNQSVPLALVERIAYSDAAPWPAAADGLGYSLQRWDASAFGNDPGNWVAARPRAGAATATNGTLPAIVEHPLTQTMLVGETVQLSVSAIGTEPFFYQWRLNGTNVAGATNASLALTNIQPHHAGTYDVIVGNDLGVTFSSPAVLTVRFPVLITQQPQTIDVRIAPDPAAAPTTNVTFTVSASSVAPMHFQWRRNGIDIPGATDQDLIIVDVQTNDFASYSVVISDDVSTVESSDVWLYPLISPLFVEGPIAQSVVVGGPVTLSALAGGWPPPFTFEWRLGAAVIAATSGDAPMSFFTFNAPTNVTTVSYRVVVKNRAFPSGRISGFAAVTTLADSNGNGLPDAWETLYGSIAPQADSDGDGMLNWEEYQAGTDPTNALSRLNFSSMLWSNNTLHLGFDALSNKTYAIQYKSAVDDTNWHTLREVVGRRQNRTESILDTPPNATRFYRLVTPPSE